jgi:hypothetical protein
MKVKVTLQVEIEVTPDTGYPMPSPDDAAYAFVHYQGSNLIDSKALHESGYQMPDGSGRFRGYLSARVIEFGEVTEISESTESAGWSLLQGWKS